MVSCFSRIEMAKGCFFLNLVMSSSLYQISERWALFCLESLEEFVCPHVEQFTTLYVHVELLILM